MSSDVVRVGILAQGIYPSSVCRQLEGLRPVMSVKARLVATQNVEPGDTVGYGIPELYGDFIRRLRFLLDNLEQEESGSELLFNDGRVVERRERRGHAAVVTLDGDLDAGRGLRQHAAVLVGVERVADQGADVRRVVEEAPEHVTRGGTGSSGWRGSGARRRESSLR